MWKFYAVATALFRWTIVFSAVHLFIQLKVHHWLGDSAHNAFSSPLFHPIRQLFFCFWLYHFYLEFSVQFILDRKMRVLPSCLSSNQLHVCPKIYKFIKIFYFVFKQKWTKQMDKVRCSSMHIYWICFYMKKS